MPIRAEQLDAHLAKARSAAGSLAPLYVIHGDEPLTALEAADAIRSAARAVGFSDRSVFLVERGFDWSELAQAGASLSLFGDRRLIELRMPTGKPGTQGAEAIVRHAGRTSLDVLTLVTLPRLDRTGQGSAWFEALAAAGMVIEVSPMERTRLPEWIGARLARQKQRASREILEFLAERVEGNLLAAHQEIQKLALLEPEGELDAERVERAVTSVARYSPKDASAALLAGDTARYLRVLEGLHGEGEAPPLILWVIAEDLRALEQVKAGLEQGRPMEMLLRDNRVWGPRQNLVRATVSRFTLPALHAARLACGRIDRIAKGIGRRDVWDEFATLGLRLRPSPPARRVA